MRLLLLSNSTMPGEPFFTWPRQLVKDFLPAQRQRIAFVPFAAVSFSMDEYADTIAKVFDELGHELISLHHESNPVAALDGAAA
nr:Type 1 glutamine amidotransferase-like domain-containing protein [Flavobacteriales bacterium]